MNFQDDKSFTKDNLKDIYKIFKISFYNLQCNFILKRTYRTKREKIALVDHKFWIQN